MNTPFGEVPEDDIRALEYKYAWYMKYACLPSPSKRTTEEAKADYGRQYERYVGYLFERRGYSVNYQGIRKGLEDGGIDLVARAPRKIRLVQCKRWRMPINADVVSRLQGAVSRFVYEERRGKPETSRKSIRGVLATTGEIDREAAGLAAHLGIYVMPRLLFESYPAIKAQRFADRGGRFLLPLTPGYDRMRMDLKSGDCFFASPRDALRNGFYYPPYHREILKGLRQTNSRQAPEPDNGKTDH